MTEKPNDPSPMSTLLRGSFALGDGRRVRWDEATITDHQAAVYLQPKLRAEGRGKKASKEVDPHQQAIDRLSETL